MLYIGAFCLQSIGAHELKILTAHREMSQGPDESRRHWLDITSKKTPYQTSEQEEPSFLLLLPPRPLKRTDALDR